MLSEAHARLHLPSLAMAGCIHMAVERDTRGLQLTETQRLNFYPASPLPSVSWIFEGELRLVEDQKGIQDFMLSEPLPRIVFTGPLRKPSASWSPSTVHTLSVGFYPDALSRLLGIRAEDHVDMIVPLKGLVSGEALDALASIDSTDGPPFEQVESALQPLWQIRGAGEGAADMRSWLALLARRAAFTQAGSGVRQLQRSIKSLAGQSQRDLQRYARTEEAFALSESAGLEKMSLTEVAAVAGYSDQSHLGREVKRVTGFSPKQFGDRLWNDESFWMYRLLCGYLQNGESNTKK